MKKKTTNGEYLKVFKDKSELVHPDGTVETFEEGSTDEAAVIRYAKIVKALQEGFLDGLITDCKKNSEAVKTIKIEKHHAELVDSLVASVTSEVGRALIGLSVLQLVVKVIEPSQSIRLHKGGRSSYNFSWKGGISMRSLDKSYITPILRAHGLLKLNADGFMMTRSLAENYPYSPLYKANLRGGRNEWLALVEEIEADNLDPLSTLKYLIFRLINSAKEFEVLAEQALATLKEFLKANPTITQSDAIKIIQKHTATSDYAARLMEISMHALLQATKDLGAFPNFELIPLSQMRSANKKHGNVGDVEFTEDGNIVVAWDAKYGKSYLRDEVEELSDKIRDHGSLKLAGFVTSEEPERLAELEDRINEIQSLHGVELKAISLQAWVTQYYDAAKKEGVTEEALSKAWLVAYTESLAQKRRSVAPIDEPCNIWLKDLLALLQDK